MHSLGLSQNTGAGVLADNTAGIEAEPITAVQAARMPEQGKPGLPGIEKRPGQAFVAGAHIAAAPGWMPDPPTASPEFPEPTEELEHIAVQALHLGKAREVAVQDQLPVGAAAQ